MVEWEGMWVWMRGWVEGVCVCAGEAGLGCLLRCRWVYLCLSVSGHRPLFPTATVSFLGVPRVIDLTHTFAICSCSVVVKNEYRLLFWSIILSELLQFVAYSVLKNKQ